MKVTREFWVTMRFRVTMRYPAELAGTKWIRSVVDVQRCGTQYGPKLDEKLFNQCQCLVVFKDVESSFACRRDEKQPRKVEKTTKSP